MPYLQLAASCQAAHVGEDWLVLDLASGQVHQIKGPAGDLLGQLMAVGGRGFCPPSEHLTLLKDLGIVVSGLNRRGFVAGSLGSVVGAAALGATTLVLPAAASAASGHESPITPSETGPDGEGAPLGTVQVDGGEVLAGVEASRGARRFALSGNFVVSGGPLGNVVVLVVGGGGGGGGGDDSARQGTGGGGGGGVVAVSIGSLGPGTYEVVVGEGGSGGPIGLDGESSAGTSGGQSRFGSVVADGGGGGGGFGQAGLPGGSGGGGGGRQGQAGGAGTAGQGHDGGMSLPVEESTISYVAGGGGGGAGAPGERGSRRVGRNNGIGGDGGPGIASEITGSLIHYGGGGGGGGNTPSVPSGFGGLGGGGDGAYSNGTPGGDGTDGLGGGGGGVRRNAPGGRGGNGTVIVCFDAP